MIYYYVSGKMLIYFFLEKNEKGQHYNNKNYIVIPIHTNIFPDIATDPSATPINTPQDPEVWTKRSENSFIATALPITFIR